MNPIRLAIIGCGHLGRIHARLAKEIDLFQIVGLVDPCPTAREQVARDTSLPVVKHFSSLCEPIDAAVVAVPTCWHHQVALDLLRADVHVFIEKPIASSLCEADEILEVASEHHKLVQVGHIEEFNPAFQAVRSRLECPKYIEAVRTSGYTFRSTDIGVVLDLMIHDLDLIVSLVQSEVQDVQALGLALLGNHEDMAQARITFQNGCVANLTASRTSFQSERRLQAYTPSGFTSIDFASSTASYIDPDPRILNAPLDIQQVTPQQREHIKEHLFEDMLPVRQAQVVSCNALHDELLDFAHSIHQSRAPRVNGSRARSALSVAEKVLQKIASHPWNGIHPGPQGPLARTLPSVMRPAA
ncbi:MAG: oxidoreductase [Planctomycetaceae bacterium]|nr:oxidoreductase [Planctomycetaceae bacterium]MBP63227.1 oxidoreductase [Planctomycetaceae bacterium]